MLYIMNMQITIWVSSVSLHAYADISFKSTSDVSITLYIWLSWMKSELIFDLARLIFPVAIISSSGNIC